MKEKYGAQHIEIVKGKNRTTVIIDSRDREAVSKYADDTFSERFGGSFSGKDKDKAREVGDRRAAFIRAAGVFGKFDDGFDATDAKGNAADGYDKAGQAAAQKNRLNWRKTNYYPRPSSTSAAKDSLAKIRMR